MTPNEAYKLIHDAAYQWACDHENEQGETMVALRVLDYWMPEWIFAAKKSTQK